MNDFIEENKKTILLIIVLIVATIIISIASLFMGNKQKMPKPKDAMKELGEIYYEEIFYAQLAEKYPDDYMYFLESRSNEGIKATLVELLAANPSVPLDIFYDKKGNAVCDIYNSYVTIKPYSPYSIEDYNVEIVGLCGDEMISGGSEKNE